jgi:hypothetical protein
MAWWNHIIINKQIKIKGMLEVFRQLLEVIGSASAVLSTKRTAEVIPERLAVAAERKSGSSSPEVILGDVRGVPLHDLIPGRHPQPPPPLEVIDGEDEYLVKKILDSKMFRGRLKFKIKWEGYRPEHDSWEYATEVYTPERVVDFYQRNPAMPRQIWAATFSKILFRPISPVYFEVKQP